MWCPKCKTEYREGITVCADCHAKLVEDINMINYSSELNDDNSNVGLVLNEKKKLNSEITEKEMDLFANIGKKIKILAQVLTWIGIILSAVIGAIWIVRERFWSGILIMLIGSLSSWISTFVLYGFGQLVDNSDILVQIAKNNSEKR